MNKENNKYYSGTPTIINWRRIASDWNSASTCVICCMFTMNFLSVSMISSIKYISPALLFNKSFLKLYQICLSFLYLIQSMWLYVDLVTNKFNICLNHCCWFYNDCLIINCSYNSKSCSVIMLLIISVISTYIIIYSFN